MTRKLTFRKPESQPKSVVLAAYSAANRGLYAKADAFIAPSFFREMRGTHAALRASAGRSRRLLVQLDLASARQRRELWNQATRGRSLVAIEAIRQIVHGSRARVYLKLTLADGHVVRDSEPLVFEGGKWLLG